MMTDKEVLLLRRKLDLLLRTGKLLMESGRGDTHIYVKSSLDTAGPYPKPDESANGSE